MIPPTPTLIPFDAGSPAHQLDTSQLGSLWDIAPNTVGLWNSFNPATQVLQWLMVALIVVVFVFMLIALMRNLSENDEV